MVEQERLLEHMIADNEGGKDMADYAELFQTADWKAEKHAPGIVAPDKVKKGEWVDVRVEVGKEIPHPNTTAHHISWIRVTFKADEDKFPYEIGQADFLAHGASAEGADTSTIYSHPQASVRFKTDKPGVIFATSYCNIHGLWQSQKVVGIE